MRQIPANDGVVYDVMTVCEAIEIAKMNYRWVRTQHYEPTSVDVGFLTNKEEYKEVQFDLWGNDHEADLNSLWNEMCRELDSQPDMVVSVDAYGYIVE